MSRRFILACLITAPADLPYVVVVSYMGTLLQLLYKLPRKLHFPPCFCGLLSCVLVATVHRQVWGNASLTTHQALIDRPRARSLSGPGSGPKETRGGLLPEGDTGLHRPENPTHCNLH